MRDPATLGNSVAIVSVDGSEVFRSETPDDELKAHCEAMAKADPEMMPYFFLQVCCDPRC